MDCTMQIMYKYKKYNLHKHLNKPQQQHQPQTARTSRKKKKREKGGYFQGGSEGGEDGELQEAKEGWRWPGDGGGEEEVIWRWRGSGENGGNGLKRRGRVAYIENWQIVGPKGIGPVQRCWRPKRKGLDAEAQR